MLPYISDEKRRGAVFCFQIYDTLTQPNTNYSLCHHHLIRINLTTNLIFHLHQRPGEDPPSPLSGSLEFEEEEEEDVPDSDSMNHTGSFNMQQVLSVRVVSLIFTNSHTYLHTYTYTAEIV